MRKSKRETLPVAEKPAPYRTAVFLAIIVFLALSLFWLLDLIAYPWAHAITGPALVGNWQGELVTASGRRHQVALALEDERIGTKSHQKRIRADVRICNDDSDSVRGIESLPTTRSYEGSGRAGNWRGTRIHLDLRANDGRDDGVVFFTLDGRWDLRDSLNAIVVLKPGGSTVTIASDRMGQIFRPGIDSDLHRPIELAFHRDDADRFCR